MRILISGDYCPIGRVDELLTTEKYSTLFNGFENIIKTVDYAIVNFECPFTSSNNKIQKTGPCLKTENVNAFKALQYAGFNMLTLANNHIQDYGGQGVLDTISKASEMGLEIVGAGSHRKEAKIALIKEFNGTKVGFLNIAENEFCAATEKIPGAYTFDLIDNLKEITLLKNKVDKIILIYHGGREHYQLPTPELRKRFRYFIENGVDAIVAHHTHCYSGYEYYQGKPIVYSLGNFIFDYKKKYQKGKWTEGMSVILELKGDNFKIELIPHFQGRINDFTLKLFNKEQVNDFLRKIEDLNKLIVNDDLFNQEWVNYIKTQERFYLASIYVRNVYARYLFIKGLLPIFWLRKKHNNLLLNLLRCETHHEIATQVLQQSKKYKI